MRNVLLCDGCGVRIPEKIEWFSISICDEVVNSDVSNLIGDYCKDCKDDITLFIKKMSERKHNERKNG